MPIKLRPSFVRPIFFIDWKTQRSTAAFLRLYSTFAFEFPAISPHFHLREIIFWVAEARLERMPSRLWAWRATNCSTPRSNYGVVPLIAVQKYGHILKCASLSLFFLRKKRFSPSYSLISPLRPSVSPSLSPSLSPFLSLSLSLFDSLTLSLFLSSSLLPLFCKFAPQKLKYPS